MADGYALALQKAVLAHLKADAGITALVSSRIYDQPPQSATRPYIRFNDFEPRPLRSDCGEAATVVFSMEAHSRPNSGRVEATRCAEAIVAALDGASFAVDGFDMVFLRWVTQTVDPDQDGQGYSAIVVFETVLDG